MNSRPRCTTMSRVSVIRGRHSRCGRTSSSLPATAASLNARAAGASTGHDGSSDHRTARGERAARRGMGVAGHFAVPAAGRALGAHRRQRRRQDAAAQAARHGRVRLPPDAKRAPIGWVCAPSISLRPRSALPISAPSCRTSMRATPGISRCRICWRRACTVPICSSGRSRRRSAAASSQCSGAAASSA